MAIRVIHLSSFLPVRIKTNTNTNTRTFALPEGPVSLTSSSSAQNLLRSGIVRPILPKEATEAIQAEGYWLLDIRPVWEWERAHVSGSIHIPLFVDDTDNSPVTLLKKWVHFGYIGLWTGQLFTKINEQFVPQVADVVPAEDEKLLIACGEGLR
jgi:rhodanese-related sulfurtransferase